MACTLVIGHEDNMVTYPLSAHHIDDSAFFHCPPDWLVISMSIIMSLGFSFGRYLVVFFFSPFFFLFFFLVELNSYSCSL